ncbi:MAG: hypothetical protein M3081_11590, partial [Gemmatimonadota bacterium]|nr:hypothetical protein [Gemmatimonadota bacterium]
SQGDPPPPPLTGTDGNGFFTTFGEGALAGTVAANKVSNASGPTSCNAELSFQFDWKYFVNKPENNAWIHVDQHGFNGHSQFHSTNKKNDASGQIVGPGFTFQIADVLYGSVFNESRWPGSYSFTVSGKLTLADGTKCNTTGNVFLNLGGGGE